MALVAEVSSYRDGVANMLEALVNLVHEKEQLLDVTLDRDWLSVQARQKEDPTGPLRFLCALLLRKARFHMTAMLRANEKSNLHSLAVQMRPILECAGQVTLNCHNLIIAPKGGLSVVEKYLNADFYDTMRRLTKGDLGHHKLLDMISEASGMPKSELRNTGTLRSSDKVAMLVDGKDWYDYLSEYFCHGRAEWRGYPWRGGVGWRIPVWHELALATFMDYLVNQVAVMSAHAALCPIAGRVDSEKVGAAITQLQEVRATSKALRDSATSVFRVSNNMESDR